MKSSSDETVCRARGKRKGKVCRQPIRSPKRRGKIFSANFSSSSTLPLAHAARRRANAKRSRVSEPVDRTARRRDQARARLSRIPITPPVSMQSCLGKSNAASLPTQQHRVRSRRSRANARRLGHRGAMVTVQFIPHATAAEDGTPVLVTTTTPAPPRSEIRRTPRTVISVVIQPRRERSRRRS